MSKIYANIKAIRTEKGLKQEDVAQKMGMAQSNYARLEKGLTQATVERLEQLSEIFGMSVSDIINYEYNSDVYKVDISYYIELCRKYEKQIELLKKRISELEEENLQDWGQKSDELKAAKEKNKQISERLREREKIILILEKAIDALSNK